VSDDYASEASTRYPDRSRQNRTPLLNILAIWIVIQMCSVRLHPLHTRHTHISHTTSASLPKMLNLKTKGDILELFANIPPTSSPTEYTCSTQTAPTPHPSTSMSMTQLQNHGAYNPPSRANSTAPISSRFWTMIRVCLCVSYPPYPVLVLILLTDAHSKIELFSLNMSSLKADTSKPPME